VGRERNKVRVTLLGTGPPGLDPERARSAVLVEIDGDALLFDAGGGVVQRMGAAGTDVGRVGPVFLTHHHLDHIGDLYDVMFTTASCGRTEPLRVFGPIGTEAIVDALVHGVYARDIRSRRDGTPASEAIDRVDARDVGPGEVCAAGAWRVIAGEVLHGRFDDDPDFDWRCLGYRIEAGGAVVAISGDTVPCDGITDLARNAELLVQCCHFPESAVSEPAIARLTTDTLPSARQAGRIAADANVRHVVLTHISGRVQGPATLDALREDVQREFGGTVTVGSDLMVLAI
jgi:ribonuclease Z